ncbi:hypothetical protein [Bradyrhizobium sp. Ce-3]|uniref:hypothetical protein n=1 Tax=Bradyrhizobium sp. Ce-3 TaxID=2913970 RepID=UPI001FC7DEFE|nr:hypothetical protein [Bradyrhizobium sp. Ce-3]
MSDLFEVSKEIILITGAAQGLGDAGTTSCCDKVRRGVSVPAFAGTTIRDFGIIERYR